MGLPTRGIAKAATLPSIPGPRFADFSPHRPSPRHWREVDRRTSLEVIKASAAYQPTRLTSGRVAKERSFPAERLPPVSNLPPHDTRACIRSKIDRLSTRKMRVAPLTHQSTPHIYLTSRPSRTGGSPFLTMVSEISGRERGNYIPARILRKNNHNTLQAVTFGQVAEEVMHEALRSIRPRKLPGGVLRNRDLRRPIHQLMPVHWMGRKLCKFLLPA